MATRTATSTTSVVVDIDTTGQVQFKRAAVTGDVSIAADANTSTIGANIVTNAKSAQMAADTVKANNTGSTANASDVGMAINTVLGRGPTGHIDDLIVDSSLAISDTGLGRAALTGAITAAAGSNTTTLANDAVLTANILDANVTTSKIALNAVGNQRAAQMAAKTVKGNSTTATANAQDMTISGGLTTDGVSVLKSKGSWSFNYTFDTQTSSTDPTAGIINLNATSGATELYISDTTSGGRNIGAYLSQIENGRVNVISNNSTSIKYFMFDVVGVAEDSTNYRTLTGTINSGSGTLPTDGEEVVVVYEAFAQESDVLAVNTQNKVVRYNPTTRTLLDVDDVDLSGTSVVTNYADLVALDTTTYADFAIKVTNGLNKSVWSPNGSTWLPLNGSYLHDRSNENSFKLTVTNAVTWTVANNGGTVRMTTVGNAAHGLTALSVGASLYLTNSPTNWTPATLHTITAVDDTSGVRTVDLSTPWVASMGVPTFNLDSTFVPCYTFTVPALRANSTWILETTAKNTSLIVASNKVRLTLGATTLQTATVTSSASNITTPLRFGFQNKNNTSVQESLFGSSSTGFAASGALATAAEATAGGAVTALISLQCNQVDDPISLNGYRNRIEG